MLVFSSRSRSLSTGFTLIELMITVAIIAILAAVAIPSYSHYVIRSKVPAGFNALSAAYSSMEAFYLDTNSYSASAACAVATPSLENFTMSCVLTDSGTGYLISATGTGQLSGYKYTIDQMGVKKTVSHPNGVPSSNCWTLKGGLCDI